MHNKSLQLSPRRPPDAVRAVPNAMQCGVDAAGQLNSMLGSSRAHIPLALGRNLWQSTYRHRQYREAIDDKP
jgi:hypothetical protein